MSNDEPNQLGRSGEFKGVYGETIRGTVTQPGLDGHPTEIDSYGRTYQRNELTGKYEEVSSTISTNSHSESSTNSGEGHGFCLLWFVIYAIMAGIGGGVSLSGEAIFVILIVSFVISLIVVKALALD